MIDKPPAALVARFILGMGGVPVPFRPDSGAAIHKGYYGFTANTLPFDVDELDPALNVAMIMGETSGFIDIDLDHPAAWELAHGVFPPTLTFGRTSKPASHLIYRSSMTRSIEVKHPDGSMFLEVRANKRVTNFPGSVNTKGEPELVRFFGRYESLQRLGREEAGRARDMVIGATEQSIIEWVKETCARAGVPWDDKPKHVPVPRDFTPTTHGRGYGAVALDGEYRTLASTPEGGRNPQCNTSAFRLGQLVASGDLDESEVKEALMQAMRENGSASTSQGERESLATIESGLAAGKANPRPPRAEEPKRRPPPPTPDELARLVKSPDGDELDRFLEFTKGRPNGDGIPIPCLPQLTRRLNGLRQTCILTGPTGVGKSTLLNTIALSVASGTGMDELLNDGPIKGDTVPVIYLTAELQPWELKLMMACTLSNVDIHDAMHGNKAGKVNAARQRIRELEDAGRLVIIDAHKFTRPWQAELDEHALSGLVEVVESIAGNRQYLVALDSLATLDIHAEFGKEHDGDLDEDTDIVRGLHAWRKALPMGSCILATHEESKERTGSGDTHAVRGSSKYAYRQAQLIAITNADATTGTRHLGMREGDEPPKDVAELDIHVNKARRGGQAGSIVSIEHHHTTSRIVEVGSFSATDVRKHRKEKKKAKPKAVKAK